MRKQLSVFGALIVGGICLTAVEAQLSGAASHRVQAELHAQQASINAGQSPTFTYAFKFVKRGTIFLLQRQFGTDHIWKTQSRLKQHGTVTAPKLKQLGLYPYRVVSVYNRKITGTSRTVSIKAYGTVPLGAICNNMVRSDQGPNCRGGNQQINGKLWHFDMSIYSYDYVPKYETIMQRGSTSCRTMTIKFITSHPKRSSAYLQVIQSASDPQSAKSPTNGTFGNKLFQFDGGPLVMKQAVDGDDSDSVYIRFAGSASCYTDTGRL